MVRNLLQLIRWKNLVIAGGTVLLTKYAIFEPAVNTLFPFSSSSLNFIETLLLAISVMSIAAGGYIINDINDIKTDQINKPEKVIIGKHITPKLAEFFYICSTILGILLATYIGEIAGNYRLVLLHIVIAGILWIYSKHIKNTFLLGNILVAIASSAVALTYFIFESLGYIKAYGEVLKINFKSIIGGPLNILWFYSIGLTLFGFILSIIREMIKDLQDYQGDFSVGAGTIPIVLGKKATKTIIILTTLMLTLSLIYTLHFKLNKAPFNEYSFLLYTWLLVILPTIDIIYGVLKAKKSEDYQRPSNTCKFIMISGILTTLIYAFNV